MAGPEPVTEKDSSPITDHGGRGFGKGDDASHASSRVSQGINQHLLLQFQPCFAEIPLDRDSLMSLPCAVRYTGLCTLLCSRLFSPKCQMPDSSLARKAFRAALMAAARAGGRPCVCFAGPQAPSDPDALGAVPAGDSAY
jgi:hypothetical protein